MRLPDKHDEAKLLKAVDKVTELVETSNTHPTEAAVKVAREEKLSPGEIRLVCAAYNNGRQLAQFESSKNKLEKFSEFLLADPDKVIKSIYYGSDNQKNSTDLFTNYDYKLPPYWLNDIHKNAYTKAAKPELLKKAFDEKVVVQNNISTREKYTKLLDQLDKEYRNIKHALDRTYNEYVYLKEQLRNKVNNLVNYFKLDENYRVNNATIKSAIDAYCDSKPAQLLYKYIINQAGITNQKQASAQQIGALSINDYPMPQFLECLQITQKIKNYEKEINKLTKQAKILENKYNKVKHKFVYFQPGLEKTCESIINIKNIEKISDKFYIDVKKKLIMK